MRSPGSRTRPKYRSEWGSRHVVADASADIGDVRRDPALAERAGDSDAVMPVKHVVPAATPVQVHRVHSAAGPDVDGYPLKPRSGQFRGGPETTVEAPGLGGLDRSNDLVDRHHRLCARPEAAYALILQPPHARPCRVRDGPHFTQHWQAVAAGRTAAQPPGQPGQARPPPGTVKIIPGVLESQSGTHGQAPCSHPTRRASPLAGPKVPKAAGERPRLRADPARPRRQPRRAINVRAPEVHTGSRTPTR